MALVLRPYARRLPLPFQRLTIDWSHPLANGLIGCWVPGISGGVDLSGNCPTLVPSYNTGAGPQWVTNTGGPALNAAASGAGGMVLSAPAPPIFQSSTTLSLYYRGTRGVGSAPSQCYFVYVSYTNGTTSPFDSWGIGDLTNNDLSSIGAGWNDGTNEKKGVTTYSAALLDSAAIISTLGTFVVGGNVSLYSNGVLVGAPDAWGSGSHVTTTTDTININGWAALGRYTQTPCNLACAWNRALSADEAALLDADPYGFLIPAEGEMPALFLPVVLASGSGYGAPKRSILRAYSGGLELPGQQPRGRMQINWSHPITRGLSYLRLPKDYGAPDFIDNGTDAGVTVLSGTPTLQVGPAGLGLNGVGALELGVSGSNTYVTPQTSGTVVAYVTASWAPADGLQHRLFTASALSLQKFTDDNWYCGWFVSSENRVITAATGTFNAGDTFSLALTYDTTLGSALYTKGVQRGTSAVSAPLTSSSAGASMKIGGSSGAGGDTWVTTTKDAIYYIGIWSRVLSAFEIAVLDADPYCFLIPAEGEMSSLFLAQVAPATVILMGQACL